MTSRCGGYVELTLQYRHQEGQRLTANITELNRATQCEFLNVWVFFLGRFGSTSTPYATLPSTHTHTHSHPHNLPLCIYKGSSSLPNQWCGILNCVLSLNLKANRQKWLRPGLRYMCSDLDKEATWMLSGWRAHINSKTILVWIGY